MTDSTTPEVSIVAVTAGTSESSTTTRLASDILTAAQTRAAQVGMRARIHLIDLKPLAQDIATALGTGFHTDSLRAAQDALGAADAAVLATPVYKASYSGLFKSFLDVADDDIVTATPVVLAATAGTPRHGLVPDTDMRALLSYMRAVIAPTTVFAATEDWANPAALSSRVRRAAAELVALVAAGIRPALIEAAGKDYTRTFNGSSRTAPGAAEEVDFSTDLMRLATGGRAAAPISAQRTRPHGDAPARGARHP
ncbi:MAG TPA: NADH-dependent FMN reductase [Pseudoclavibacter sp.]|nr:NADH-dependent FMN reductase [Pseudoclavibacter sp.]